MEKCNKCNGNCKPSKGIINIHNLSKSGEGEFETKIKDCLKCENCGHSFIPNKKQVNFEQVVYLVERLEKLHSLPQIITRNADVENFKLFIEMMQKSSAFAHKAHKELKKYNISDK